MKPLVALFLLSVSLGYAPTNQTPGKEFTVSLSDENVTLVRGEHKTIEIKILKSRAYQKGKIKMGVSSALPEGLTVSFDPETGNTDATKATITALADATPGTYNVIVNATVNYKTKGSILKITVE